MIFDIDFNKWIALMLPTFLRKRRLFAFCRAICSPLYIGPHAIYNRLLEMRGDHIYALTHNCQVCYLRAALNDAFGLSKGFEIHDSDQSDIDMVYAKDAVMSGQLLAVEEPGVTDSDADICADVPLIADEASQSRSSHSFIVRVPGDIYATRLDEVKAIVAKYKTLSKTPVFTSTESSNEQSSISVDSGRRRWEWPLSVVNSRSRLYPEPN